MKCLRIQSYSIPEGNVVLASGDPAGEAAGEAADNIQVVLVSRIRLIFVLSISLLIPYRDLAVFDN